MPMKRCCVCNKTRAENVILHLFPNPEKEHNRYKLWVNAVGGDTYLIEDDTIYNYYRVCHIHFAEKDRTWSKRLSPNAVPTLNLRGNDEPLSPSSLTQSSPVGRLSTPAPEQSSPVPKLLPASPQPGPSWRYPESEFDVKSFQPLLETLDLPSSRQLQQPSTTKRKSNNPLDNADEILDYPENKKKKELNDTDHLFKSYAESFKKLSVRNQAKMKVALAKLFAEAELDEFENNNLTNKQTMGT